jgi:tetratricopeptide (TPR) repeat protein
MHKKVSKVIEEHYREERWAKARNLILRELKSDPNDHWYLTRLSGTYYEEHKYKKARQASDRAVKLAPHCPLVLWDRAGIVEMSGQPIQAIAIWKRLLKRGTKSVAFGTCGEGLTWAKSLLNDCRYRIANTYRRINKAKLARIYYKAYISHRDKGVLSIYSKRAVKKQFASLLYPSTLLKT